jgi:cellulose synthase (UDP-forming)
MSDSAHAGVVGNMMSSRRSKTAGPMPAGEAPFLVPALSPAQQRVWALGLVLWLFTLIIFWVWWLQPDHIEHVVPYIFVTLTFVWLTLMPLFFFPNVHASKKPSKLRTVPQGSRVAMVVTKAPSEPFVVIERTLEAMLAQDYPHDTWLADEDPSEETVHWCEAHNVLISTRRGRDDYHRKTWPRRTRCKEGNLAFFYDHYGYERYDFVAQLDADHVPTPSYLREILYPFADPAVGYVSAPSICDMNADESWAARGRLFPEGMLHGPLQSCYTNNGTPLCIGSHYAVRTQALMQAGGLGPELAEDHSTTMLLIAAGWRGVHAIDAIAHGDGPQSFADFVTQEFQWSRSLVTIMLEYSPTYLPRMTAQAKFQFLFRQLWYPLLAGFSLLMYAMPIYALLSGETFANVTYVDFLIHYGPNAASLIVLVMLLKAFGLSRPLTAKTISWEGTLVAFLARWPWVLAGTLSAVRDHITKSFIDFRVTPKGSGPKNLLPTRVVAPYVVLAVGASLPVLLVDHPANAAGFYWFAAFNAFFYGLLVAVIVARHVIENKIPLRANVAKYALHTSLAVLALSAPAAAFYDRGLQGIYGLQQGAGHLRIVRVIFPVSGAGQGGLGNYTVHFDPSWDASR